MEARDLGLLQKNYRILSKERSSHKNVFLILGILGIAMIAIGGRYSLYRQTILSFNTTPPAVGTEERKPIPKQIKIPSLSINLPVEERGIVDGIWQIPDRSVAHLVTSASPDEGGNVVIYGHNKKVLFGPLVATKIGAKIILITQDDVEHEYTVTQTVKVDPSQISWVLPEDEEMLTIYTCTGFIDSERLIIRALPSTPNT